MRKILLTVFIAAAAMFCPSAGHCTVTSSSNQITYAGDNVSTNFSFPFKVYNTASENDLVVYEQVVATGSISTLSLNTNYTVSLNTAIPSAGSITLTAGALPSGTNLTIIRQLPLTQQVNESDNSPTPASVRNNVYDRQVMLVQQLQQQITRAILQNPFATTSITMPSPVAGYAIGWDPTGTFLTNLFFGGSGSTLPIPIPNSYLSLTAGGGDINGTLRATNNSNPVSGAGLELLFGSNVGQILSYNRGTSAYLGTNITGNPLLLNSGTGFLVGIGKTPSTTLDVNGTVTATLFSGSGASLTNIPAYPYVKITNTQNSGTNGGTATATTWTKFPLNTKDNDTGSIATLASNQITLPAGTYKVRASAIFYSNLGAESIRLYNVTDSAIALTGQATCQLISGQTAVANLDGLFTISDTKTLEFQYYVSYTRGTYDLGGANSVGPEVYQTIIFEKIG